MEETMATGKAMATGEVMATGEAIITGEVMPTGEEAGVQSVQTISDDARIIISLPLLAI